MTTADMTMEEARETKDSQHYTSTEAQPKALAELGHRMDTHADLSLADPARSEAEELVNQARALYQPPKSLGDLGIDAIHTAHSRNGATVEGLSSFQAWSQQTDGIRWVDDDQVRHALVSVARGLDRLAEQNELLAFVPDHWFLDATGAVYVNWPAVSATCFDGRRLTEWQRNFREHMHSGVTELGDRYYPAEALLRYSFALFLFRQFMPVGYLEAHVLADAANYMMAAHPMIPPGIPVFFKEIFSSSPADSGAKQPGLCCAMLDRLFESFDRTPRLDDERAPDLGTHHTRDFYSVPGRNKSGLNEDSVYFWPQNDSGTGSPAGVLAIADGVSTAEVGSGRWASQLAIRVLESRVHELSDFAGDEHWANNVQDWLDDRFEQMNRAILEEGNRAVEHSSKTFESEPEMMSSTMVVAVVRGDMALVGWVGDSPAWHFLARESRLQPLTYPHDETAQSFWENPLERLDIRNLFGGSVGGSGLTRYLGQGTWSNDEQAYVDGTVEPEFQQVRLTDGDLLVLASDGLQDSIDETADLDKIGRIRDELQSQLERDADLRELSVALTRLGEDARSIDNISVGVIAPQRVEPPEDERE